MFIKTYFVVLLLFITPILSQTYCAGDQISLDDQNIEYPVGAGYGDYDTGDIFKLSDLNGDVNGGEYHVIFIDLSTSWCDPCYYTAPYIDELEEEFESSGVKFITALADPGQPYSFEDWQAVGDPEMPLIINDDVTSPSIFDLFHDASNSNPAFVIIDHTMQVRGKPRPLGANSNTNVCDGSEEYHSIPLFFTLTRR